MGKQIKYVLFDFKNFTPGDSFCCPCCMNISNVYPEDDPLKLKHVGLTDSVNRVVIY
jgi:hypothetical protein